MSQLPTPFAHSFADSWKALAMDASTVHVSNSNIRDPCVYSFQDFDERLSWDKVGSHERHFTDLYRSGYACWTHFRVLVVQARWLLAPLLCGWCITSSAGCDELRHSALRCCCKSFDSRFKQVQRSIDDHTSGPDRSWRSSLEWIVARYRSFRVRGESAWFHVLASACSLRYMDSCNVHDHLTDVSDLQRTSACPKTLWTQCLCDSNWLGFLSGYNHLHHCLSLPQLR